LKKPKVSYIITTKNEEEVIWKTLKSITKQTYQSIEVIIIDSLSNDRTYELLRKFSKNYQNIRIFKQKSNIPQGRNFGALKATGDIFYFQDADTQIDPFWIEKAVDDMILYGYGMIVGRIKPLQNTLFYRFLCYAWSVIIPYAVHSHPGCAGILVTRKKYYELKCFDEKRTKFEDVNFTSKGRKIINKKRKDLMGFYFNKDLISYSSMRRFSGSKILKELFYWPIHGLYYLINRRPAGIYGRK
jgi:glycosyltransferase involved in cell wall biosynthesis